MEPRPEKQWVGPVVHLDADWWDQRIGASGITSYPDGDAPAAVSSSSLLPAAPATEITLRRQLENRGPTAQPAPGPCEVAERFESRIPPCSSRHGVQFLRCTTPTELTLSAS